MTETFLRCCFCGLDTTPEDYVELTLRIPGSPARQSFGAHRSHLAQRLAPGFVIELEPVDDGASDMAGEGWARVSVRVVGERLRGADIAARLQQENESRTDELWTVHVGAPPDPLMDQIDQTKAFLRTHQAELVALSRDCEVNLLVSWTPRSPQDGIGLDSELIALLASMNGYLLLDTYLD